MAYTDCTVYGDVGSSHASPGSSSRMRCFSRSNSAFLRSSSCEGSDTTGSDAPAAANV